MNANFNNGSLYVGDLHPDVTEPFLYEVFREVGPIVSIRVCRDAMSRKSLGYAYVNFQNPQDAERALDTLNYSVVKGMPIRIMWSQRDPAIRKSGIGNVFIKNLDKSIDNKALYDTFSAFGNILSCKVCQVPEDITVQNEQGEEETEEAGSGYGFVHFETQEAAEQAIAKVNGMLLNGRQVYVGPFVKKNERMKALINANQFTNIFVKNLDKSVSEDALREMFTKFGEIQSCVVMIDDKGSKGFGFINYTDHEAAAAAVDEMNGKEVESKKLFVGRAQKKAERSATLREKFEKMKVERANKYQGVNVYVKNLEDNVDDEALGVEFAKFGAITSAVVMRDEKGVSKGFGFVCFSQPEEATRAMTEMNGKILGTKPLYVAIAQRKDERRSQLEAQHRRMTPPVFAVPAPGFYGQPPVQGRPYGYPVPQVAPQPRWQRPVRPATQPVPGSYSHALGAFPKTVATRGGRGGSAPRGNQQARRGDRGYKYNATARNKPADQSPTGVAPQNQIPVQEPIAQDALSPAYLAQLSLSQQKQLLGEKLYPLVVSKSGESSAPKITGMLLDMEVSDILHLLEDASALDSKIDEALLVLKEHQGEVQEE